MCSEEIPLWSIVHCTADSYKTMVGEEWPGDDDSRVHDRSFQDGVQRKVISVTFGIPNAWQERVRFNTTQECTKPQDSGRLVFQGLQQQHDLNMKRMKDMWNKFQQASETRPSVTSLPAMPASFTSVQQELQRIVGPVIRISSQAVQLERALAPAEDEDLHRTPAKREGGSLSQLLASPPAVGVGASPSIAASPEAPSAQEPVLALQDESLGTDSAAPAPAETRAVRASLLGTLDAEDDEEEAPPLEEPTKKTKEAKAIEAIAAVRQLFLQAKQTFWLMRTDAKVVELTLGASRPGYLTTR